MSKRGAGIAFMCGSKMLLLKRSKKVRNPHTWSPPGGNVEKGETDLDAAIRESDEEILNIPKRYVITGEYEFRHPDMKYTMYVAHILKPFNPRLNWENEDFRWVDISQLGRYKLHPRFAQGMEKIKEMHDAVS